MTVDKTKYKNIEFFSNFSYIRPIYHGSYYINSSMYQDLTVPFPVSVTTRPALVDFYIEWPTGTFWRNDSYSGLRLGADTNNIKIQGFFNPTTDPYTIHYIIYDRSL